MNWQYNNESEIKFRQIDGGNTILTMAWPSSTNNYITLAAIYAQNAKMDNHIKLSEYFYWFIRLIMGTAMSE